MRRISCLRTSSAAAMSMSPRAVTTVTDPLSLMSMSIRRRSPGVGESRGPRRRGARTIFYQRPPRALGTSDIERDLVGGLVDEEEAHAALGHRVEIRRAVEAWIERHPLVLDVDHEAVGPGPDVDGDRQPGLTAVRVLDDVVADLADGHQQGRARVEGEGLAHQLRPQP